MTAHADLVLRAALSDDLLIEAIKASDENPWQGKFWLEQDWIRSLDLSAMRDVLVASLAGRPEAETMTAIATERRARFSDGNLPYGHLVVDNVVSTQPPIPAQAGPPDAEAPATLSHADAIKLVADVQLDLLHYERAGQGWMGQLARNLGRVLAAMRAQPVPPASPSPAPAPAFEKWLVEQWHHAGNVELSDAKHNSPARVISAARFDAFAEVVNEWRKLNREPPSGAGTWHPISSAPKDGTDVLLCWQDGIAAPMFAVGHWLGEPRAWQTTHQWLHNKHSWPTHWMELPAAPTSPPQEP